VPCHPQVENLLYGFVAQVANLCRITIDAAAGAG
jgi:hypothetical protein